MKIEEIINKPTNLGLDKRIAGLEYELSHKKLSHERRISRLKLITKLLNLKEIL